VRSGGGDRGGSGDRGGTSAGRAGSDSGGDRDAGTASRGGVRSRDDGDAARGRDGNTPTYSRPRGDRPATGRAVPRRPGDGSTIIIDRGGYGGFYPWGWGGLGLGGYYGSGYYGGGYYDPWAWGWYDPYPPAVYRGAYEGAVRLKVKPRDAEVYVDGYFAGEVDDYDGVFQRLKLEPGPHRIEVRLEGYEPLSFEVRILPDRTITYKGEMEKLEPTD
jgi:hypothetical protein